MGRITHKTLNEEVVVSSRTVQHAGAVQRLVDQLQYCGSGKAAFDYRQKERMLRKMLNQTQ